jgi:ABC-type transporter Mla subunit MlaD
LAKQREGHWLECIEAPALTGQLDQLAQKVEAALPGLLSLTNQIRAALTNTVEVTAHLNATLTRAQPILTNLAVVTAALTNGPGALGEWLFPTNLNARLDQTLAAAHSALGTADTNMAALSASLSRTLDHLANLTSNLNAQVRTNDQLLPQISRAVIQADQLMQGLRRHWLLRSAFKEKPTNQVRAPARSGRSR